MRILDSVELEAVSGGTASVPIRTTLFNNKAAFGAVNTPANFPPQTPTNATAQFGYPQPVLNGKPGAIFFP
jgi:hypothetical protein